MNNDLIMAAFQVGSCLFLLLSVLTIFQDRELKGVSVWMIGYFTVWTIYGIWNWYRLDQFWSYTTSIAMSILYVIWLSLAIYVKIINKPKALSL